MALFRILGIEFSHLPADAEVLQHHCKIRSGHNEESNKCTTDFDADAAA
jgi:hypothetical protein